MNLKLKRPIIFFDLETTGVDTSRDRIVEISLVKIMPDGEEIVKTRRINPTIPIPKEASTIHHIIDEDVKDCPTFRQVARSFKEFIEGCDFGGFNSNRFDLPLLVEEFMRAAYKFYCHKELGDAAHGAQADTMATYEVLKAQLDKYPDLENDIDFLSKYSSRGETADFAGRIGYNDKGEEIFLFGKYRGQVVAKVFESEPSYYDWMMKGDFPQYTKKVITEIKLRGRK